MYNYESDTTAFLRQLIKDHPELQEERLRNRAILWDVHHEKEDLEGFDKAAVPPSLYPYQKD